MTAYLILITIALLLIKVNLTSFRGLFPSHWGEGEGGGANPILVINSHVHMIPIQ